jgi:hypothetical protein
MKLKPLTERYGLIAAYAALMLGMGVWQLLDWRYGSEDPIWHIFFYLFIMPLLSGAFGLALGGGRKAWLFPLSSGGLAASVYFFMANGGLRFDLAGALELCVPSLLAACAGVALRRLLERFG